MSWLLVFKSGVARLQDNVWYALFIAILAVLSIVMLSYEFFPGADPALIERLQRFDIIIAFIFLTDFFTGLFFNNAVTKKRYWRENWLNLVSSIPITADAVRVLRIVRLFRAFRVIRAGVNFWFAKSRLDRVRQKRGK
jgi:hypothetical protein